MPIRSDLFMAILAMDAYNRGYDSGLNVVRNQHGNSVLRRDALPAGFQGFGVRIGMAPEEIARLKGLRLVSGMPVDAFIRPRLAA